MNRRSTWSLIPLLLLAVAGCSGSSPSTAPATNPADAAAQAGTDFLDAVLKGDSQRASHRLTPAAIEQIAASGKQFAPPGLETASFRIGEVRLPSPTHAIVQFFLSDQPAGADAQAEEIACLLRFVENDWRVSGLAFTPAPNRPPVILNFEKPPQNNIVSQQPGTQPSAAGGQTTPRTAQQVEPAAAYR